MQVQVISRERHGGKFWRQPPNSLFAAGDALVPLVAREAAIALLTHALGFLAGERLALVAVMGVKPGDNLFVTPDGRWLGNYIPAVYRGYPFYLVNTEADQQMLCIDEAGDCLVEEEGNPFFDEQSGEVAKPLAERLDFLRQLESERRMTEKIVQALQEAKVLTPWNITVKSTAGEEQLGGLLRVDEVALNSLDPIPFLQLRDLGALPLVYCQLLSMQNLQRLGPMAEAKERHRQEILRRTTAHLGGADDIFQFNF